MEEVFIVTRKFNRDDQCEVICSSESYVTDIVGVYATRELAEAAALADKRHFFDPIDFAFNEPDDLEDDGVYPQTTDDDLTVYAEDYDYGGVWGEFAVEWYVTAHTVHTN